MRKLPAASGINFRTTATSRFRQRYQMIPNYTVLLSSRLSGCLAAQRERGAWWDLRMRQKQCLRWYLLLRPRGARLLLRFRRSSLGRLFQLTRGYCTYILPHAPSASAKQAANPT